MTKEFENKIQEIIDEACDKCEYSTDGCESLFLENQVKDIVKKAIEGIWHKPSEEPANGCKIIVVEKLADNSICHDIGYYNKARNIVACELSDVWFEHCARWAYIEDLVKATLTDF